MRWLKQALPSLAAMACILAFLAGFVPPSIVFAQTLVTQTDTPALHFRDYGLKSLEPLLSNEARRGLASGRIRPSLSTLLHPARYGLVAPSDEENVVSVTELLCLNRENRSLQLSCRQEGGTRRLIRLSEEACAQRTPLHLLLPPGCQPYVSTIEGRLVTIRLAHRPETAAAQAAHISFAGPRREAPSPPPQESPSPGSQTGPPIPPTRALDPPHSRTSSNSAEILRLRKENARLRRQLTYALGLPVLLFLLALGYTIHRAWRARKPISSAQEEPAPNVDLDTRENAPVSPGDELRASREREEANAIAEQLLRADGSRAQAERERDEAIGNLSTLNARTEQIGAECAQLREHNATLMRANEVLQAELRHHKEASEEADRRSETAERAYADQRNAHEAAENALLRHNLALEAKNTRLQRELADLAARVPAPETGQHRDAPGAAVEGPHPHIEGIQGPTSDGQWEQLDFADLAVDLPVVLDATARPTSPDGSPSGCASVAPSIHEKETRAHTTPSALLRACRDDEGDSPVRAKTTKMPAALQAPYIEATRQPPSEHPECVRRNDDGLLGLATIAQPPQDSGVWPRTENGDRASDHSSASGRTGE